MRDNYPSGLPAAGGAVSPRAEVSVATRRLPLLATAGAIIFTGAWLILGFVSPGYRLFDLSIAPYSAMSQPISGLGLGVTAPFMNAAFVMCGLLVIAGSIGMRLCWPSAAHRRAANATATLLALGGVGMVVDGIFTLESVLAHLIGFVLALLVPAIGLIVGGLSLRRIRPKTSAMLLLAGPLAIVLFAIFMVIFEPYDAGDNVGVAGLVQRLLAMVVLGALGVLGVLMSRESEPVVA